MKYLFIYISLICAAMVFTPKLIVYLEFKEFCDAYMNWVKQYPEALNPGECQ
jgi:hypothetical protein